MRNDRNPATAGWPRAATARRAQRGVVLLIALIVLVAMTMVGLAVMRASGGSVLMAGNLSFRQNATVASDYGVEIARAWLRNQGSVTLKSNQPGVAGGLGYFAVWDNTFNPAAFTGWYEPNAGAQDTGGHRVDYVIHRMCALEGASSEKDDPPPPPDQECVTLQGALKTGSKGGVQYGEKALAGSAQVYYRITARVRGPKNTTSIVQAMVY